MRVLLISVISVFFFVSCVSLNTNQTGRSLGANNNSLSTSISYGHTQDIDYGSFADNGKYYFGNLRYQRGLTDKFDIGITLNLSTFIITSLKYQVIGTKKSFFASSVGFDLGYTPVSFIHVLTLGYTTSIKSYNSIHFNDKFALTFCPSYVFVGQSQFADGYGGKYHLYNNMLGYSFAFVYGKRHKLVLEFSKISSFNSFTINPKPTLSLGYIYCY